MTNLQLPAIDPQDRIILFDSVCKLCNHWSRFILRFDKYQRFKLCSVQSPQGQALLAHYNFPLDQFDTDSQWYLPDAKRCNYRHSGGHAFALVDTGTNALAAQAPARWWLQFYCAQ